MNATRADEGDLYFPNGELSGSQRKGKKTFLSGTFLARSPSGRERGEERRERGQRGIVHVLFSDSDSLLDVLRRRRREWRKRKREFITDLINVDSEVSSGHSVS